MILLAGPGVALSTVCLGVVLKLTFPYNWSWKTSLLLGGLLSATDPVAVVALLKDLGASKKLSTIIEGESLMNDGTAIVVYTLFYRMVLGETFNWVAIIKFLAQVSLGAVGMGLAFGIASVLWLGFIFNDTVIEIALTFAVSYIAYFTKLLFSSGQDCEAQLPWHFPYQLRQRSGGKSSELTPETGTLRRILNFTKYEMLNKALEAFGELGDDEELGPADWPTVKRYISCLNDIEGECVHPHGAPENDSNLDPMNLKDIRVRLLNGMGTFTFVSVLRVV
ncbi:hypothetical protein JHK85_021324 [Glycine max]|nr:hypothetical protein JHK85_021324 [Glycine max]